MTNAAAREMYLQLDEVHDQRLSIEARWEINVGKNLDGVISALHPDKIRTGPVNVVEYAER